jgi:hypothetical protein
MAYSTKLESPLLLSSPSKVEMETCESLGRIPPWVL